MGLYYTNAGFLYSTKPKVVIYGLDDLTNRIFCTTTHELAHATHHIMFQRQYNWKESNDIIHESWADAVEGYTIKQVASALSGVRTIDDLRPKIKSIRNNTTENVKIDTLFNKYKLYWDANKNKI